MRNTHDITIESIPALTDNYIWAIVHTKKKSVLLVDPGETQPALSYLQQHQLLLSGILLTHHHWDHVNGVAGLLQKYTVPVFAARHSDVPWTTHFIGEQDIVALHDFPEYQVMAIPGHTADHLAYYAPDTLFCGDTLFTGGCGRVFSGTAEQLYASLQKIASLPDETKIYCAHEYTVQNLQFAHTVEPSNQYILHRLAMVKKLRSAHQPSIPSTLAEEKQTNPFLRCGVPEIIHNVARYSHVCLQHPIEVFSALRQWKNHY